MALSSTASTEAGAIPSRAQARENGIRVRLAVAYVVRADREVDERGDTQGAQVGIDDPAVRVGHAYLRQSTCRECADGLNRAGQRRQAVCFPSVVGLDCREPVGPFEIGWQPGAQLRPDVVHMHAAKHLVRQIGEVRPPATARRQHGAMVQPLAVNEGAVDVPGDRAYRHDSRSN